MVAMLGVVSLSAQRKSSYIGFSSDFSYMPSLYHTANYGVFFEKQLTAHFNILSGYYVERFQLNQEFYGTLYGNIPLYMKYVNPIVDVAIGVDVYNYLGVKGLSTLYTKGYSYAVGGGVVLSKDIALSTRILLEPTINVRINKPIASWGIARFGYGLKLKYVL